MTLLLCCMLLSACAAESLQQQTVQKEKTYTVPKITLPKASRRSQSDHAMLYFDGLLADRACVKNGLVYISPESICDYYGVEIAVSTTPTSFEISGTDLYMSGSTDNEYLQANYRYLYTPEKFVIEDGRVYLSKAVIERVFGVKVTVFGDPVQVELSTDGISLIQGGADYYAVNYSSEDLFWLPRIIYAETKDQPMAGLIAVGNVVHNRLEHEQFPDTVFEVIFDNQHAVQFTPAATGAVLDDPDERSIVAAYLCLEGYNTAGESLYFVNPDKGASRWCEEKLQFVCTIGDHDFYTSGA